MRERASPPNAPTPRATEERSIRRASGTRRIDPRFLAAADGPRTAGQQAAQPAAVAPAPAAARLQLSVRPGAATLLVGPASAEILPALMAAVSFADARVTTVAQHSDAESGSCFQRIALSLLPGTGASSTLERRLNSLACSAALSFSVSRWERPRRVALFVSKYDHCLRDLLLRQRAGELDCEIPVIVSNHPDLAPIARQFGVEYELIGKRAEAKSAAEAREQELLESRSIDLVVLARYMQILSSDFTARWAGRVINIHHSLLPAFVGAKPYHQAWQRGVKLIGATAHYATAELDQGPIIEQEVARCTHEDTVEDLVRKGRDLERLVLARAVRWHLSDRVLIHAGRTIVFS
ncbi:MAG TPA: formyltetrahydrofolate deformylase [Polyangiaceae bacterium]|nr:formyltetrahydrofolate deformylase [Polyangiaceae bacterium]